MTKLNHMLIIAAIFAGTAATANEPVTNVDPNRHSLLAGAQQDARQAYDLIVRAQAYNHYNLGGHAERAKTLLEQTNVEIKLAAEAANANH